MLAKFHATFGHGKRRTRFTKIFSETFGPETVASDAPASHPGGEERVLERGIYERILSFVNSLPGTRFASHYDALQDCLPLLPDTAQFVSRIEHLGIGFATRRRAGLQNSFVLFRKPGLDADEVFAGQIESIFYHSRRQDDSEAIKTIAEPFFLIDEYCK